MAKNADTVDPLNHYDDEPDAFLGKIMDHVDENSLSQSEERLYYKKMARRVRLIMAGLDRSEARKWRNTLYTLAFMR